MKVIFMGTPEFSCPTLQKLIDNKEIEIIAVYTKEPQKKNRGQKITNSAIHNLALKNNIKVITPKTLKDKEVQKQFINFNADIAIVAAYGLLLPKAILQGTKFGCINLHPSILPKWRGAAPIQRTIMGGDKETGITIMKMDEGLDSGDIIFQNKFSLDNKITAKELEEKFAIEGADIVLQVLQNIKNNNNKLTKQDDAKAVYAKKISKTEAEINWNLEAEKIHNLIRGLSGNIGSFFIYQGKRLKILKAEIIKDQNIENYQSFKAGDIIEDQFIIICGKDAIKPLEIQKEGKRKMDIEEFLLGIKC